MEKQIYSPKQFGKIINRSVSTLQRWDYAGILIAKRYPTGRRYYTYAQALEVLGTRNTGHVSPTGGFYE